MLIDDCWSIVGRFLSFVESNGCVKSNAECFLIWRFCCDPRPAAKQANHLQEIDSECALNSASSFVTVSYQNNASVFLSVGFAFCLSPKEQKIRTGKKNKLFTKNEMMCKWSSSSSFESHWMGARTELCLLESALENWHDEFRRLFKRNWMSQDDNHLKWLARFVGSANGCCCRIVFAVLPSNVVDEWHEANVRHRWPEPRNRNCSHNSAFISISIIDFTSIVSFVSVTCFDLKLFGRLLSLPIIKSR